MDLAAEFIDRHKEKAIASLKTRVQAPRDNARQAKVTLFIDRHAEYYILDQSLCACDGLFVLPVEEKAFSGLPQAPPKRPSGFPGAEQLLNLLKPNCFPLDFRELPIPNNPFFAKDLA